MAARQTRAHPTAAPMATAKRKTPCEILGRPSADATQSSRVARAPYASPKILTPSLFSFQKSSRPFLPCVLPVLTRFFTRATHVLERNLEVVEHMLSLVEPPLLNNETGSEEELQVTALPPTF